MKQQELSRERREGSHVITGRSAGGRSLHLPHFSSRRRRRRATSAAWSPTTPLSSTPSCPSPRSAPTLGSKDLPGVQVAHREPSPCGGVPQGLPAVHVNLLLQEGGVHVRQQDYLRCRGGEEKVARRGLWPPLRVPMVVNLSCGNFLSRFREALFYYSALFDMLDVTMSRESQPRLVLEREIFGQVAMNAIACEGEDWVERGETYKQWQVRNQRAGLRQFPLNRETIKMAKDMVKNHYNKNFVIDEGLQWLLQGWKGQILFAHSTWVADSIAQTVSFSEF
ncbi:hypothetical protein ACP70R_007907 [Stipagrostis hirtigluma subsp. patula]